MTRLLASILTLVLIGGCQQATTTLTPSIKGEVVKDFNKVPKEKRIIGRYEQELEMTADPATGKIPDNRLVKPRQILREQQRELASRRAAIPGVTWEERGPNNVGGRTRTMMFDPNDPTFRKVWAGSVAGGLWYCDDITSSSATWQKVDDFWDNMAVTSIAYDPTDTQVFYAGTGEAYGNFDAVNGDGIWKSSDGGATWSQLGNTASFSNTTQIVVLSDGTVLAGNRTNLRRSTDQGATWTTPTQTDVASLSIAADGAIYLGGFSGNLEKSTNGGANWTSLRDTSGRRVEVAASLSDADVVYGLCYNANGDQDVHWFQRSDDGGSTWSNLTIPQSTCNSSSTHFTRRQGWYDLTMIVHPTDPDKLVVGGVDCHTSEDGGNTWKFASNWTNCSSADYVHADIHDFIIRPGSNNSLLVGCDGGVFFTDDVYPSSGFADFEAKIQDYNVTQFYHGDIHPGAGVDYILAGAQDNGTHRMDSPGIDASDEVTGGDGAFTHIDHDEPNIQISAYVYNYYWISTNGFTSYQTVTIGNNLGRFINPTDYDYRQNILYGAASSNQYSYVRGIGGVSLTSGTTSVNLLGGAADCIKVSPNVTNRVYIGNDDVLLIVDNAHTDTPSQTAKTAPVDAYMSCIEIQKGNEDHILVTYSSYGVQSVWETLDGGDTWSNKEGDLPNIPVRSVVFNPNDNNQALVATELGVWSTDDLNPSAGSVDWEPTNSGLANVRTDHLRYRESDNEMIAVTHGRGVFSSSSFDCGDPSGCYTGGCRIGEVEVMDIDCDSNTDTYSADITIIVNNTPASGTLQVNGQDYVFDFSQAADTVALTLSGAADGGSVDLVISFTDGDCDVTRSGAFTAPTPGCGTGLTCTTAEEISGTGTYTVPSVSSGGGCENCGNATNAYWYSFTPVCDGEVTIASCGYGVDTRMFLYSTDTDCNNLSQVAGNDDACEMSAGSNAWASEVVDIPVSGGTQYFIEWDDRWSAAGFDWDMTLTQPVKLFVDKNAVGSDESGCSWANAITDLSNAIDIVNEDPNYNELWLKSATYYPGSTILDHFLLNDSIAIYGGFDGSEVTLADRDITANPTILSGDIGIPDDYTDNCQNVVVLNEIATDVLLDGLIIEDGSANSPQWPRSGGGIMSFGSGTIRNCTIRDCQSAETGSAIHLLGFGATVTLENVTLSGNTAADGTGSVLNEEGTTLLVKGVTSID